MLITDKVDNNNNNINTVTNRAKNNFFIDFFQYKTPFIPLHCIFEHL